MTTLFKCTILNAPKCIFLNRHWPLWEIFFFQLAFLRFIIFKSERNCAKKKKEKKTCSKGQCMQH